MFTFFNENKERVPLCLLEYGTVYIKSEDVMHWTVNGLSPLMTEIITENYHVYFKNRYMENCKGHTFAHIINNDKCILGSVIPTKDYYIICSDEKGNDKHSFIFQIISVDDDLTVKANFLAGGKLEDMKNSKYCLLYDDINENTLDDYINNRYVTNKSINNSVSGLVMGAKLVRVNEDGSIRAEINYFNVHTNNHDNNPIYRNGTIEDGKFQYMEDDKIYKYRIIN